PFGQSSVGEPVPIARFADIPILAKTATKVATRGAKRQDAGAWREMIERLFLDRIDAEPATTAVSGQSHPVARSLAHETESALAFVEFAKARTEPAFDAPVGQHCPPTAWVIRLCDHGVTRLLLCFVPVAPLSRNQLRPPGSFPAL